MNTTRLLRIATVLLFFGLTACTYMFWSIPHRDNAWLLVMTERFLAGGTYVRDFVEANPPLILFLNVPAIALARLTGLLPFQAYALWVCLIGTASILLARPYLDALSTRSRFLSTFAYSGICLAFTGQMFGEREHLASMLLCPAICWFAARSHGIRAGNAGLSASVVVLGAVGALIKPHLILVPVALLAAEVWDKRSWRAAFNGDTLLFAGVCGLYAAIVVVRFPEWFTMVQTANDLYFAYNRPLSRVLEHTLSRALLPVSVLVFTAWFRAPHPLLTLARYASLASLMGCAAVILQMKTWPYHHVPSILFGLLGLLALVLLALESPALRLRARVATTLGMVFWVSAHWKRQLDEEVMEKNHFYSLLASDPKKEARAALYKLGRGRPILVIGTAMKPAFPMATLMDSVWTGRGPNQWLVPGILKLNTRGDPKSLALADHYLKIVAQQLAEDLQRGRPEIVGVCKICTSTDLVDMFTFNPDFVDAWSRYKLTYQSRDFDFFELQTEKAQ